LNAARPSGLSCIQRISFRSKVYGRRKRFCVTHKTQVGPADVAVRCVQQAVHGAIDVSQSAILCMVLCTHAGSAGQKTDSCKSAELRFGLRISHLAQTIRRVVAIFALRAQSLSRASFLSVDNCPNQLSLIP
jgi:hypothetical protein